MTDKRLEFAIDAFAGELKKVLEEQTQKGKVGWEDPKVFSDQDIIGRAFFCLTQGLQAGTGPSFRSSALRAASYCVFLFWRSSPLLREAYEYGARNIDGAERKA